MKGTKMQKGITLIALIITIVVLLILAVVAISAVQDSDILIYADRSVIMHKIGVMEENILLKKQAMVIDKTKAQIEGNETRDLKVEEVLKQIYKDNGMDYENIKVKILEDSVTIPEITDRNKEYYLIIPEFLGVEGYKNVLGTTAQKETRRLAMRTFSSRGEETENNIIEEDEMFIADEEFNVYYLKSAKVQIVPKNNEIIPEDEMPEDLERYILGDIGEDGNRPGRILPYDASTGEGLFDVDNMAFVNQFDTLTANGGVQFVAINPNTFEITFQYMNEKYLFNVTEQFITYNLRKLIVKELNAEGKIEAIEDLVDFAMTVNNGNNLAGKTITLEKSLNFNNDADYRNPMDTTYGDINGNGNDQEGIKAELTTGTGFIPIGSLNAAGDELLMLPFSGNFDGKGNTISNLYINNQGTICAGLFGVVGTEGNTIKNFTLVNPVVNNAYYFTGGIIGYADGSSSLNVENCYVIGNSTTSIIGSDTGGNSAGGIIGEIGAFAGNQNQIVTITGCTVKNLNIYSPYIAGGIIAGSDIGTLNVSNCVSENTTIKIVSDIGFAAGIAVGHDNINSAISNTKVNMSNCNTIGGSIDSEGTASGIFIAYSSGTVNIKNCNNTTSLISKEDLPAGILSVPYWYNDAELRIENCHNSGSFQNNSGGVGICHIDNTIKKYTIINCSNVSSILSNGAVAGIAFVSNTGEDSYIINCYNTGDLTGGEVGGISFYGANIYNCYNAGRITNTGGDEGGISITSSVMKNCYTIGSALDSKHYTSTTDETCKVFTGEEKNTEVGREEIDKYIEDLNEAVKNNEGAIQWKEWTLGENGYPVFAQ